MIRKILVVSVLALTACEPEKVVQKFEGQTQGTTYHVSFWSADTNLEPQTMQKLVDAELERLDKQLSNYRADSAIEQFNASTSTQPQEVGVEIVNLIEKTHAVSKATQGCYDLTIKPLFDLWGFKGESLIFPEPLALTQTLLQVGFSKLEIVDNSHLRKKNPTLKVDMSSIGQGYSVSKVAEILENQGATNYLVEIGGELQTRGKKPDGSAWRVALEKPLPDSRSMHKIISVNQVEPFAITTAGTYRHFFDENGRRYSHILNAKSGEPITHNTVSVTVFDQSATTAELWDTALLCVGRETGIEIANQAGIAALFIEQDGENFNEFKTKAFEQLKTIEMK